MGADTKGLDGRSREVLTSVICTYIKSAFPVSSRQLTRERDFGLSTASLRNAMADLEDRGFLTHPHVSAGRVPTDLGYRTFVRELMTAQAPSLAEKARMVAKLEPESYEIDHFLQAASRVLSALTGEIGVVAAPHPRRFVLQSVYFTSVAPRKILVVQVGEAGLVESRLIETRESYSAADLEAISRRLTADYAGKSLEEIRRLLVEALQAERVLFDSELDRTLQLGQRAFIEDRVEEGSIFVEGTETMLEQPEFQRDVEGLRRMFRVLFEKARLVRLLTDCLSSLGTTVFIGSENPLTDETQTAMVVASYSSGPRVIGTIGVIGPRRMEYARVVPMVEELGRYLTQRLTQEDS